MSDAHLDSTDKNKICALCDKVLAVCVCDRVVTFQTHTRIVILQHPQEQDRVLGSAPLIQQSLPQSSYIKIGLSLPPLAKMLDKMAVVDMNKWFVVYPSALKRQLTAQERQTPCLILDKHHQILTAPVVDGIILLDGTWSQAKSLWWRNSWLLKLGRMVLHPQQPSMYGRLRAEPKSQYLSTLEAACVVLDAVGETPEISQQLRRLFRTMLQRIRDAHHNQSKNK